MDTTLNPKQTDPPHVLVAGADEEFAHAHEQIARAGEEIARAEEQLSKLEHDAARHPSDHPQTRMNTFRPAVPGNRPLFDRPAVRGFTGLLLAACIGVAAIAWQSSYGDAAIIATWAPQRVVTSSPPLENPGLAQTAPEDVAPTAAALSPELTQLLESMIPKAPPPLVSCEMPSPSRNCSARSSCASARSGTVSCGRGRPTSGSLSSRQA